MQKLQTFLTRTLAVAGMVLMLGTTRGWTTEPTLARLSFWVPPERMAEFAAAYEEQALPVLKQNGLIESSQRSRATVDNVFSRLFELETTAEITAKEQALQSDPAWQDVLRGLGTTFSIAGADDGMRHRFGLYTAPAGEGTTVLAGPGFRQGLWQNFSSQDGLPSYGVMDILQDRGGHLWFTQGSATRYDGTHFTTFTTKDLGGNGVGAMLEDRHGHLWFGTWGGGAIRYDGTHFSAFTTEDGLAHNSVQSIVEDRQGNLWFGTGNLIEEGGGVSRYDGAQFTTFTTEDGLAHNGVQSIVEDRQGNLWFGTGNLIEEGGGVSRYDGAQFTTFTTEDGLAHNDVQSIVEDRQGNLWFGTRGGVSRYDETQFLTEDGLGNNLVRSIVEDRQGNLWFGAGGGVSRYDGQDFVTFTTKDGLAII